MAIDKLNFSGINSGSKDFDTPLGSIADRLTKYGLILNQQDAEKAKQKRLDDQDAYQKQRDARSDANYDADKKERLEDKNRLLQRDYNTANAMSAIENKDAYIAGRISSEQKAIQDTMASATPEERLQMQQELKGYDPKASGQQWANTALSQSNVDAKDITNLKRDIAKEAEQTRQFNENKRIAQENADRAYSLQKKEYDQRIQERADLLKEKTDEKNSVSNIISAKLGVAPKDSDVYIDKTGKKIIPEDKLKSYNDESGNLSEIDLKNVDDIQKQLAGLAPVYTEEQLKDRNFQEGERQKLYPDAAKSTIATNALSNLINNIDKRKRDMAELSSLGEELRDLRGKLIYSFTGNEKEKNALIDQEKSLINKIEQVKINQNKPVSDTKNVSLDEFMNINKAKNEDTKKLQESLSTQLASIYTPYEKKAKDKFSVEETVQKQRPLTTQEFEKNYTKDLIDNFVKINGTVPNVYDLKQINSEVNQKTLLHSEGLKTKQTAQEKIDAKTFEAETKVAEDKVKRLEDENKILLNSIEKLETEDQDKDLKYLLNGKYVTAAQLIADKNNIINNNKNMINDISKKYSK